MNEVVAYSELRPKRGMTLQSLLSLIADHRRTREGTGLASAARTTDTSSADLTNHDANSLICWLNVTVASGTGGIKLRYQCKDPVSGGYYQPHDDHTVITSTGLRIYLFGPSLTADFNADATIIAGCLISRTFRFSVVHSDASSYTYSVGYCLIP